MKLNSIKEVYFLIPSPTKSLSKTYNGSGTLFLGRALCHIWGEYYFKYLHTNLYAFEKENLQVICHKGP